MLKKPGKFVQFYIFSVLSLFQPTVSKPLSYNNTNQWLQGNHIDDMFAHMEEDDRKQSLMVTQREVVTNWTDPAPVWWHTTTRRGLSWPRTDRGPSTHYNCDTQHWLCWDARIEIQLTIYFCNVLLLPMSAIGWAIVDSQWRTGDGGLLGQPTITLCLDS